MSPAWGLRPKIAILGLGIKKSFCIDLIIFKILSLRVFFVTEDETLSIGIWSVNNPTFRFSPIMNIRESEEKNFERNSVWPMKLNVSDRVFFLFIGAVTRASISPNFKDFVDAKSDFKAT